MKLKRESILDDMQISEAFLFPVRVANESYLRSFQYKVLNFILFTNDYLCKIEYVSSPKNIQATISAFWLAQNMSINPKLVNSAISPVQKSEIECKTVKLKWLTAPTKLSWDKQNDGQKLDEDWNSVNKILIKRLHNKAKY